MNRGSLIPLICLALAATTCGGDGATTTTTTEPAPTTAESVATTAVSTPTSTAAEPQQVTSPDGALTVAAPAGSPALSIDPADPADLADLRLVAAYTVGFDATGLPGPAAATLRVPGEQLTALQDGGFPVVTLYRSADGDAFELLAPATSTWDGTELLVEAELTRPGTLVAIDEEISLLLAAATIPADALAEMAHAYGAELDEFYVRPGTPTVVDP